MYNIAICEDERVQAEELKSTLKRYKSNRKIVFNIDCFQSGEELIKNGYEKYHIIFMDINMNILNGIETAKIIRKTNESVKIIFVTAYEKYWAEGYKVKAYRYLLKPIEEQEFFNELDSLFDTINKEKRYIYIKKDSSIVRLLISDITYMVIKGRSVAIYTSDNIYYSKESIHHFAEILKVHNFAKPHNSYLVNMEYINLFNKDKLILLNGEEIYISKRKYKEFKDIFTLFLGGI